MLKVKKNNSTHLGFVYAGGDKLNKKILIIALALFALPLVAVVPVSAEGPSNAGGIHGFAPSDWHSGDYGWPSENYVGLDYGAGSTPTPCAGDILVGPIGSSSHPATLLAKGHYFSDTAFTEKDWVCYKFWLNGGTVEITFPDSTYTATKFIVITQNLWTGICTLGAYK